MTRAPDYLLLPAYNYNLMNLKNRPAAFTKRMIAPVLYFTLLGCMSEQLKELLFYKIPSNDLNALGIFIYNIPPLVPWVLFAVGAVWFIATFFGKGLQLRSPLFILGASYLIFYFFDNIYWCAPLVWLSVALITPYILQHLITKQCNSWIEKCSRWLEDKLKEKEPQKKDEWLWQYDSIKDGDPNSLAAGRKEIVELICDEVKKMSDDRHSFTIGLEGGWGTGKSTLFEHIKKSLKGKDSNGLTVECIDFSPWAYPEGQNLSIEFLHELRRTLTKHSFRVRFVVNSYINALTSGYSLGPLRMLLGILFPKESLSRVKQKLNELILFHNLKLVVFIDDLDRLDEKEIAEVFKMLRNTGDIANTVYLVAYDRINVERFDKFCKGFLDKIINVEIDLSPYDGFLLFEEFLNTLENKISRTLFGENPNFNNIRTIQNHPHIIRDICSYRDINKLTNSVKSRIELLTRLDKKLKTETTINIEIKSSFNINFIIFLEIVKMKDYSLYIDIKNQHIYKDDFSKEIRENFIKNKDSNYGRSFPCEYEDRFKEMLVEYLVCPPDSKKTDDMVIYIPRSILRPYFASNTEELRVTLLIQSLISGTSSIKTQIYSCLEIWAQSKTLKEIVVKQTCIILKEIEPNKISDNFTELVTLLISMEDYFSLIESEVIEYCNNNEAEKLIDNIEFYRDIFDYKDNIATETTYDRLYNSLVEYYKRDHKELDWYKTVIKSQEERIDKLVYKGYIKRASKIKCWSGMNSIVHNLSDGAKKTLKKYAQENPEKFLTEWVFVEVQNNKLLYLQDGIISLFSTANELKEFIDEANERKKSIKLDAMSTLIYEFFICTPVQKQYPVGFLHCNNQILDAITGQDTTN